MYRTAGPSRFAGAVLVSLLLLTAGRGEAAQVAAGEFVTGQAAAAAEHWNAAMQAFLERTDDSAAKVEDAFGALLELKPSALRVALLAQHTVDDTPYGGAVLLFEQDLELKTLGPNGQQVGELLKVGREQMREANDGWYFCQVGRFDVADANFRALLDQDPDPVALLELTEQQPRRKQILFQLIDDPQVGESVRKILSLLDRGEQLIKADPARVERNIARLGGPPRGYENALAALKDSGEYAIPFMIDSLRDSSKHDLLQPIVRALPQIDRPALNPLVLALRMDDPVTKQYVIEALGKIGYTQAVPYLLQLAAEKSTPSELQSVIAAALAQIAAKNPAAPKDQTPAEAFYTLANGYFANQESLAADPRLDTANVWYWRDNMLVNIEAPTPIFNEVMCLRCCEEALRLDPTMKSAIALWLAADFRREAQLPLGKTDPTRTENTPPASYFAEVAGAEYCLLALGRAVDDHDTAVALGMIAALRKTAGPASLVTDSDGRLPLAEALTFPDRMVRIRAAITLGLARPMQTFDGYQNLMPVLVEALMLHGGGRNALVVDPDAASLNVIAAGLRGQDYEVLTDASLYTGLEKVRNELPGIDVIFIASDIKQPGLVEALNSLRSEFRFAATPVVIVTKPGDAALVDELVRRDHRLNQVPMNAGPAVLAKAVAEVMHAVGAETITPEAGAQLALDAGQVLRLLAETNNSVFDLSAAQSALLATLSTKDETLRMTVIDVLGYLGSAEAQEAIAAIALNANEPEATRVKVFAALAEAAKRRGALLGTETINQIVQMAESDPNMTIREAAGQALGALSVTGEPASKIIRDQYQG